MPILEENDYNSDEEIDKKKHNRLLNEVLQLDQRPLLKKAARTEPTTHVSEFNLIKSAKHSINLNDLTKSLKQKSKHAAIGNKIKTAQKTKTLLKPLEKPQADRIRRTVGFKKTKSDLNKWNAIVEKNRVAAQLSFPLHQGEVDFVDASTENVDTIKRYKSELDIELAKLEPPMETIHVEQNQNQFPLSMEEIVQRRREIAKLRAHQSYQEAKAYKKNKIKSKTYHRIKRKDKLKRQIKEFEMLQKTDPEEALRKLEQLEKTRAEERMSLRHRSTGAWAKSKQVRAKYDKDSRQALAHQLSLSRELTQKLKADSSDSENENENENNVNVPQMIHGDHSNPWIAKTAEVDEFISSYRKYWDEKNQTDTNTKVTQKNSTSTKRKETPTIKQTKKNQKRKTQVVHCNSSWTVTSSVSLSDEHEPKSESKSKQNMDDMFENLEDAARSRAKQKLTELEKNLKERKKKTAKKWHIQGDVKSDLMFQRERQLRPDIDEELKNMEQEEEENTEPDLIKIIEQQPIKENKKTDIDPNKYMQAKRKTTELQTQIPQMISSYADDNEEDSVSGDQKHFIQEAFADDDIINDFTKEKNNLIAENQPKDVDLTLPGWGAWGGKNIQPSKRKRKRFIIKMPKDLPRRDQNKGHLIVNEHKSKQIKKHQVSEIPFPFTSVKDFEASIRAPIGDTFVPQTAFRRLIKPAIVTKKGAIIEPITDTILLKQKFTQHGFMVK